MQSTILTSGESEKLREQLRVARAKIRASYMFLKDYQSEFQQQKRTINEAIDRDLAILLDVERSGYFAEIFSRQSNRGGAEVQYSRCTY